MVKKILHRSSKYFFGLVLGKGISTLTFIFLARVLLNEKFGQIVYFSVLVDIATIFATFGLNQWYQKKAATTRTPHLLFTKVFYARIVTLFFSQLCMTFFLWQTRPMSLISSFLFLLLLIPEALLSISDGFFLVEQNELSIALKHPLKFSILLIGLIACSKVLTVPIIFLLMLISSSITMMILFPWKSVHILSKDFTFSVKETGATLRASASFAVLIVSSFFYARGDALAINYISGSAALGLYGAAYRYLESFSLLPTALSSNLFGVSAQAGGVSWIQLAKITFIMMILGALTGGATFLLAPFLTVGVLGPSYMGAISLVKIFSLGIFLFFVNAPLAAVVQSSMFIKNFLPYGIFNTITNIALNVVLLPYYGIVASAWIMIFTEVTGLVINSIFVYRLYFCPRNGN